MLIERADRTERRIAAARTGEADIAVMSTAEADTVEEDTAEGQLCLLTLALDYQSLASSPT
jgi:hypothetical protein